MRWIKNNPSAAFGVSSLYTREPLASFVYGKSPALHTLVPRFFEQASPALRMTDGCLADIKKGSLLGVALACGERVTCLRQDAGAVAVGD